MTLRDLIKEWILRVQQQDQPSPEIKAFNFGLIETENGYTTYLIGAKSYSEDDDWACEEDYTPSERYLELPKDNVPSGWSEVQETIAQELTELLRDEALEGTFLRTAEFITTGFDDGDLTKVKNAS